MQINYNTDFFKYHNNFAKLDDTEVFPVYENCECSCEYTIAITVYNRSQFLKQCVDSALHQTTSIPYRVVVLKDNPSNDGIESIMDSYRNDPRVGFYKKNRNEGLMNNMNRAITLTDSPWVILVHDDDYLLPKFIEEIDKYKRCYPSFKFFSPKYVALWGDCFEQDGHKLRGLLTKMQGQWRLVPRDFLKGNSAVPTGFLYNRQAFIESGGFDENYGMAADYVFFARISKFGKFLRINKKLFVYRYSANESLKESTQMNFRLVDYYLSMYLMKHYTCYPGGVRDSYEKIKLWYECANSSSIITRIISDADYNRLANLKNAKFYYNLVCSVESMRKLISRIFQKLR